MSMGYGMLSINSHRSSGITTFTSIVIREGAAKVNKKKTIAVLRIR